MDADPSDPAPPLPDRSAVALKEWAGVCDALAAGLQCVLLRKGGIDEGPGGFTPEHRAFWLYPTRLHQAAQGLRFQAPGPPPPPEGTVEIRAFAVVHSVHYLDRPERLDALADLHAWTDETIRDRFAYRRPGLWVLGVRAYRRGAAPWRVAVTPEQAGCKSWVGLETPLATDGLGPALGPEAFAERMGRLRAALAQAP